MVEHSESNCLTAFSSISNSMTNAIPCGLNTPFLSSCCKNNNNFFLFRVFILFYSIYIVKYNFIIYTNNVELF